MVAEIKAKLVLETAGGVASAVGGGSAGGGMAKAFTDRVTIPITDILSFIGKGIDKLVRASPVLSATMKEFGIGIRMALMPIAETISTLLRPFILKFNRVAFKFYDDYVSGGLWTALLEGMKGIWEEFGLGGTLQIASLLAIGGAVLSGGFSTIAGMVAGAFGLGTAGATGGLSAVLIPALIAIAGVEIAKAFGFDSFESGLIGLIGAGAYLVAGPAGLVAIPITMVLTKITTNFQDKISKFWAGLFGSEETGMEPQITTGGAIEAGKGAIVDKVLGRTPKRELIGDPEELKATARNTAEGMISAADDVETTWRSKLMNIIGLIGLGTTAASTSGVRGGSTLASALFGTGQTAITTADESMVPAFQRIGTELDVEIGKVDNLKTKVESLPDINRTIVYTVKYKRG